MHRRKALSSHLKGAGFRAVRTLTLQVSASHLIKMAGSGSVPVPKGLSQRWRGLSPSPLGSAEFVDRVIDQHSNVSGYGKGAAQPMRFGEWGGLCTMRDPQEPVVLA